MCDEQLRRKIGRWIAAALVALGATVPALGRAADAFPREAVEFFEARVRPVLAESCVRCHGEKKQSSELRIDSREALLAGGANGPAVIPGKPDESLLIEAIRQTHDEGGDAGLLGSRQRVDHAPVRADRDHLCSVVRVTARVDQGLQVVGAALEGTMFDYAITTDSVGLVGVTRQKG